MISVLIPYWSVGDVHRDRVFDWILRRWKALLPDSEICVAQGDSGSRSAARNFAFASSKGDVLVVADADTMVRAAPLRAALKLVQSQRTWVLPYTTYFNVTEADTKYLLELPPDINPRDPSDWDHRLDTSVSGVLVMPREAWSTVNGYDEQFVGWGYEDNAMALALDTLWAPCHRIASSVLHLWHEVPEDGAFNSPMIAHNRARFRQYEAAVGHPLAMATFRGGS